LEKETLKEEVYIWYSIITECLADAEVARDANRCMDAKIILPPKCKTPHFPVLHWSSSVEFGIRRYYDPG